MSHSRDSGRYAGFERRVTFVSIVLFLMFCVLVTRLWELQIVRAKEFRGKSENNRLRLQRLEPPRGLIYGRSGGGENVVLADNRPARDLMFVSADCDVDPAVVCERLESIVGVDAGELLARIQQAEQDGRPYEQIPIKRDVPRGVAARVEEYAYALPGVISVVRPIRRYVHGEVAGMILGYLGEVNPRELEDHPERYRPGDLIGRSGLERTYEARLRGQAGAMLLTQYAMGRPQLRTDPYGKPYMEDIRDNYGHVLAVEPDVRHEVPGDPLYVTLDIQLQQKAESLLVGERGAIVVLDAATGEVYALASRPGYDPGVFVNRNTSEKRAAILTAKPNRMLNRAYQEMYAPGSTFKILLAAAALEEGVIDEKSTYHCSGRFRLTPNSKPTHCWWRRGHGHVDVNEAIATSCDVFFYQVGLQLGVDRINEWCDRLGFGRKSGLDLPGEVAGLVPNRAWKKALMQRRAPGRPWDHQWFDGDTVNLSIGQGSMSATPLQTAVLMASVLNGGRRVQPYLLRGSHSAPSERFFGDGTLRIVQRGMQRCIEKTGPVPTGTGKLARIEGMTVLGKTGSAQVVSLAQHEPYETEDDIPKDLRDHAWFIAGVMDREPRIAVCVLVEHGHHGSSAAAPLAKDIIEFFYDYCVPESEPAARLAQAGDA